MRGFGSNAAVKLLDSRIATWSSEHTLLVSRARTALDGDGAVRECFDEVLDYEVFALYIYYKPVAHSRPRKVTDGECV
jgi:hypothetical protein